MQAEDRSALATRRSQDVLAFLAGNPFQSYTMTELCKRLDISPSSLHAILSVMTRGGFLNRHASHKTYSLGPMAVVIGEAARQKNPHIEVAQRELSRIANDLTLRSAVVTLIEEYRVTVSRGGPRVAENPVGKRVLHSAPLGAVFAAWRIL